MTPKLDYLPIKSNKNAFKKINKILFKKHNAKMVDAPKSSIIFLEIFFNLE